MVKNKEQRLIGLYRQQLVFYQELYAVVKLQHQLCLEVGFKEESSLNAFNRLTQKRQKQMDLIEEVKKKVENNGSSLQEELKVQEISEKIKMLINEILTLDLQVKDIFKKHLNLLQQKIDELQTERKLLKKYYKIPQQKEGYFIDSSK